jgi:hypothetical protein
MSNLGNDKMIDCIHDCCNRTQQYRTGKSSSLSDHKQLQSNHTHQGCNEECAGWDKLPKDTWIAYIPPVIVANQEIIQDKVFKLLWILNPTSYGENIASIEMQSKWTLVTLHPNDCSMLTDPKLCGYIFDLGNGEALMCDYVNWLIFSCV